MIETLISNPDEFKFLKKYHLLEDSFDGFIVRYEVAEKFFKKRGDLKRFKDFFELLTKTINGYYAEDVENYLVKYK